MKKICPYSETSALALEIAAGSKFLFRASETKTGLGVGNTKFYQLLNQGLLEGRRHHPQGRVWEPRLSGGTRDAENARRSRRARFHRL
jgi:hypothetical protein